MSAYQLQKVTVHGPARRPAYTRPKVVVFVGNGFTISLSHHLGIHKEHDTQRLMPPPPWLQEATRAREPERGPLWSAGRYPQLFEVWEGIARREPDPVRQFRQLCQALSNERAFEIGPDGTIVYESASPGLQLRWYLWRLFRELDRFFDCCIYGRLPRPEEYYKRPWLKRLRDLLEGWPVARCVWELIENFDVVFVSFNYDFYLERVLYCAPSRLWLPVQNCQEQLFDRRRDSPIVLKPHGSCSFYWPKLESKGFYMQDMLAGFGGGRRTFAYTDHIFDLVNPRVIHPFAPAVPQYPDVVPPGHSQVHLMNPFVDAAAATSFAVAQAEAVGAIGFSAAPPDTKEFHAYLRPFNPTRPAFYVARDEAGARQTIAAPMLERTAGPYRFFAADDCAELPAWLSEVVRR